MTEKEEKAIEYTKEILKYQKLYASTEKDEDFLRVIDKEAIETVLKALKQKDKLINKLCNAIKEEEKMENICPLTEPQDCIDIGREGDCEICIMQHFKKIESEE